MKRVGAILPLLTLAFLSLSCTTLKRAPKKKKCACQAAKKKAISVHGHRGARSIYPENTLPALKYALELGVEVLEFDLGISKDGVVVLNHNVDIDPVICQKADGTRIDSKNPPLVKDLTLAEIKQLDCGSLKNPRFPKQKTLPGTSIPTLEEVFQWIQASKLPQAKTVLFNIETKIKNTDLSATLPPAEFVKKVLAVVNQYKMLDRVIVQSFNWKSIEEVQKQAPEIQTSLLCSKDEDLLKLARQYNPTYLSPKWKQLSSKEVKQLQKMGVKVAPWTANDREAWDYLVKIGVDAIITDDPEALMKYLGKAKK